VLSSVLKSENCTISTVLLTHWHRDHVGGVAHITKICPDATFSKLYPTDDVGEFFPIHDGDVFAVEGGEVRAVFTPGHTTDHTAFYMKDTGALFTGDSILGQGTAVFENLTTYVSSLKKQLNLNPSILYPAHGPVVEAASEKIQEYIAHRQQREDEIIKVFKGSGSTTEVTPADIVKVIYAQYPRSLWPAAERGVVLHLEKLRDEGKARTVGDGKWDLTSRL
jgi:endoribonuclease LACTB2